MSQKLPLDGFKWVEETFQLSKDFIENYNDSDEESFLSVDVHDFHNDLLFLPDRIKIGKVEKLIAILYNEKNVIHIRKLKQALNNGLILKKVHRVIKFNQEAWLKPYIDMNTELK